jgi:glucoselysine-6-phosphate deglycase
MNEHAMMDYILEEPKLLQDIYDNKKEYCKEFVDHFLNHNVKRVYIAGQGTPYDAGMVIRFLMEMLLGVEVSNDYASVFDNHFVFNANGIYKPDEMLLICPAQSGRTKGPVLLARKAKKAGIPVACVTLHPHGVLADECSIVIDKKSGSEESFPETKGYIATLAIFTLCIIEAAYALHRISNEQYFEYFDAFQKLPQSCEDAIQKTMKWYEKHKRMLLDAKYMTFIGYGANYATAIEGGLKVLESTLKPCLTYECEEYMHGQNQPVNRDSVIFFVCPHQDEMPRMHDLITWCRRFSDYCILVATPEDPFMDEKGISCKFTDCPVFTPIEYIVPFQLISYLMAKDMGLSTVTPNHKGAGTELSVRFE